MTDAATLKRVHELRWKSHWGKNYNMAQQPWPQTDADWRQTPHGAPWDANVHMAEWHLAFAQKLLDEGLLRLASCDTQPKAGDVQQAPLVSGAVPREDEADAQTIASRNPK